MHALLHMWKSEDSVRESVSSSHRVGSNSGLQTRKRAACLLSHLTSPPPCFWRQCLSPSLELVVLVRQQPPPYPFVSTAQSWGYRSVTSIFVSTEDQNLGPHVYTALYPRNGLPRSRHGCLLECVLWTAESDRERGSVKVVSYNDN